jgi:hypothetical protein
MNLDQNHEFLKIENLHQVDNYSSEKPKERGKPLHFNNDRMQSKNSTLNSCKHLASSRNYGSLCLTLVPFFARIIGLSGKVPSFYGR